MVIAYFSNNAIRNSFPIPICKTQVKASGQVVDVFYSKIFGFKNIIVLCFIMIFTPTGSLLARFARACSIRSRKLMCLNFWCDLSNCFSCFALILLSIYALLCCFIRSNCLLLPTSSVADFLCVVCFIASNKAFLLSE